MQGRGGCEFDLPGFIQQPLGLAEAWPRLPALKPLDLSGNGFGDVPGLFWAAEVQSGGGRHRIGRRSGRGQRVKDNSDNTDGSDCWEKTHVFKRISVFFYFLMIKVYACPSYLEAR